MADTYAKEAKRCLHAWGWCERADPTQKYVPDKENGRPDLMCVRNGWGIHIEVKNGTTGFDFSKWNDDQRKWAKDYGTAMHLWFWLVLGIHPPNYNPDKYDPRQAYLFPHSLMADIEERLKPYSGTLPYRAKHQKIEIQNQGLIAPILLAPYRLQWNKGIWNLPAGHPFHLYNMPLPSIMGISENVSNGQPSNAANP